jgi:hypothetical protein
MAFGLLSEHVCKEWDKITSRVISYLFLSNTEIIIIISIILIIIIGELW